MTHQQTPPGKAGADAGTTASADVEREHYRERAHLIALLATFYPAVLSEDEPLRPAPDAPKIKDVVYLDTSRGQLSWHLYSDDVDELFGHVRRVASDDDAARFDGHKTPEKYGRVRQLTSDQARAFALQRQDDERYIVEIGAEPPVLVGMERLKTVARERIERARHLAELDCLRIWRWLSNNGRTEQLALVPLTNPASIPGCEGDEGLWELRSRSGMRHALIEAQFALAEQFSNNHSNGVPEK